MLFGVKKFKDYIFTRLVKLRLIFHILSIT